MRDKMLLFRQGIPILSFYSGIFLHLRIGMHLLFVLLPEFLAYPIVIGSQQYTKKDGKGKADVFANAIKHDFKSKNPTTRWSDIIKLK